MDKRYAVYCQADPHFYDSISRSGKQSRDFRFGRAPVPEGWVASELEDWLVHHPIGATLPAQGWKVHVSACLDNAERVLATVADYCRNRRIAFKFRRSPEALLLTNAKDAHRGSSGKFITLYPADEAQLETVLTALGEALDGSAGPYVLSDLRWGNGPLYVRYWGFARRIPTFQVPEWVSLPAFLKPHLEARNSVKVDGLPYQIERALHFSNGGGRYVGHHTVTGAQVVLKEARPHAGKVLDICATELAGTGNRLGLDLYGGLAGIGLNLAHFAAITGDPALRSAAFDVAQAIADRLGNEDAVGEVSGGSHPYAHRHDDQFAEATDRISRAARSPFYIQPGLFHGRVLLGGRELRDWADRDLAQQRVLIPQEAYVFVGTVEENLTYLRDDATLLEIDEAVDALGARELVDRLGGYRAELDPTVLSAGERQLVALARAYLSPARLVILDEATCHLDPVADSRVESAFAQRPGTLVVVAHRISSAFRAQRILVLDGSRPLVGTHQDLLTRSPLYQDLVCHWHPHLPSLRHGDISG